MVGELVVGYGYVSIEDLVRWRKDSGTACASMPNAHTPSLAPPLRLRPSKAALTSVVRDPEHSFEWSERRLPLLLRVYMASVNILACASGFLSINAITTQLASAYRLNDNADAHHRSQADPLIHPTPTLSATKTAMRR